MHIIDTNPNISNKLETDIKSDTYSYNILKSEEKEYKNIHTVGRVEVGTSTYVLILCITTQNVNVHIHISPFLFMNFQKSELLIRF